MTLSAHELKQCIGTEAIALGFDAFGVAPIPAELRVAYFKQWLADGQHGEMEWMANGLERRLDPTKILPEAKSMIVLGLNYYQEPSQRRGKLARYALGADYHDLIYKRLKKLCMLLREHGGINKPYVDTGPILEKAWAEHAGLGWQGKHTNVIHTKLGNWLFLSVILTSLELPASKRAASHCGSCSRCITACPTSAITGPWQLDARRCISYLTIEHKGAIPPELRTAIGDHLYGCDDCLNACPWNRWAQQSREAKFAERPLPDIREMLRWNEATFREIFQGSPIKRLGLHRWLRNCCIVLGNSGNLADLDSLKTLAATGDSLVAEHATWAIEQIQARMNAS